MFNRKNIAIVIPTLGNKIYLTKCLNSISKQSILPSQVIVVTTGEKKIKLNYIKKLNIKIIVSKFKNQVYQRTLGLKYLSKNIKIILQLDDYVLLKRNSIKELLISWNKADNSVAGIGLNSDKKIPNSFLFHLLTFNLPIKEGKVLKNGFNTQYSNIKKEINVDWLKGGLSSYKLKLVPSIFKRKFLFKNWSVCEDLAFSYNVKQKYNLLVVSKARVRILNKKKYLSNSEYFNREKIFSEHIKYFVLKNSGLSLIKYYYSIGIMSLFGILYNLVFMNFKQISRYLGRLSGIFVSYKVKLN